VPNQTRGREKGARKEIQGSTHGLGRLEGEVKVGRKIYWRKGEGFDEGVTHGT